MNVHFNATWNLSDTDSTLHFPNHFSSLLIIPLFRLCSPSPLSPHHTAATTHLQAGTRHLSRWTPQKRMTGTPAARTP